MLTFTGSCADIKKGGRMKDEKLLSSPFLIPNTLNLERTSDELAG